MIQFSDFIDKLSTELVTNLNHLVPEDTDVNSVIYEAQKVTDGGVITSRGGDTTNQENTDLSIFEDSERALKEDILYNNPDNTNLGQLTELKSHIDDFNTQGDFSIDDVVITLNGTVTGGDLMVTMTLDGAGDAFSGVQITPHIQESGKLLNVGQFLPLINSKEDINSMASEEHIDRRIFELLPSARTRQQRINDLFNEFTTLSGDAPVFQEDEFGDLTATSTQGGVYDISHDISAAQENPAQVFDEFLQSDKDVIGEEDSYITRLNTDANDNNRGKTIQSLRDTLNDYLKDVDTDIPAELEDDRPEYENLSDGFLKIRNLNQGIIIRKQEGTDVGLEKIVTIPANTQGLATTGVEGGNNILHPHVTEEEEARGPSYLMDGFTITMWVKFLDKTAKGTLFNYGNPLRSYDPRGFRLETYVLYKHDEMSSPRNDLGENRIYTWGEAAAINNNTDLFANNDYERFIRLVVFDHLEDTGAAPGDTSGVGSAKMHDSHLGIFGLPRDSYSVPELGFGEGDNTPYKRGDEINLLNHTRVPIDFNEWFFVVANYNPLNYEITSDELGISEFSGGIDSDYWRGNRLPNGQYTHYSGYGSKCKVEIISKSDLLRARGYAPEL